MCALHVVALEEHAATPHCIIQDGQMDWQVVSWHW
jgi:hypothetical protein